MKKIDSDLLRGLLGLFILSVFSFSVIACSNPLTKLETQQHILKTALYYIKQKHVQPKEYNDDFSKAVWQKHLDFLDPNHNVFLASDIQELKEYELSIDDEMESNSVDFFQASYTLYKKRIVELNTMCETLLKTPFSFSKQEVKPIKNGHPKNVAEQKELWRKILKQRIVKKYIALQNHENLDHAKTSKFNPTIEKKSRNIIGKWIHNYFDRILSEEDQDNKFGGYMNAILFQIDPHTTYHLPIQSRARLESISKRFYGIGISIKDDDGDMFVERVLPSGSAYLSGLIEAGDQILQVENAQGKMQDVYGLLITDIATMVRGERDTEVRMLIKRGMETEKMVSIRRTEQKDEARLARSAVIEEGDDKVGIIYLPDFYDDIQDPNGSHSSVDVLKELEELKKANIKSLILDLRGNPGGSLNDVVRLAGAFIGEGPKVQIKNRQNLQVIRTDTDAVYRGPLVVMIDEASASASELFAAVIQDYKRGIIIGGPTSFGKGTAQETVPIGKMANPSKNSPKLELGTMAVTSFQFYRINGESPQLSGVLADIPLPSALTYTKETEKEYHSALVNNKIAPAEFIVSNALASFDILSFATEVRKKERFAEIDRLSQQRKNLEKESVPLDVKGYIEYIEKIKVNAEEFQLAIRLASEEQLFIKGNGAFSLKNQKWYSDWIELLKTDSYLAEAAQVANALVESGPLGPLSTLKMEGLLQYYKVDGIKAEQMQDDFAKLTAILNQDVGEAALEKKLRAMEGRESEPAFLELLQNEGVEINKKKLLMGQQFVKNNPDSYVSLYLLDMEYIGYSADSYSDVYNSLSERLKATSKAKVIEQRIADVEMTMAGTQAKNFSRKNQHGQTIKLDDYKGKYVLLDFWGSWCIPCRLSHPHLKELYEKYHDKGFEIIGVAHEKGKTLEERQKPWLKAIDEDDAHWIHVLNDEDSDAPDILSNYGITSYPTKILLDKDGKIVMRVTGFMNDELDQFLKNFLKN